jgi:conserved hypothetical protein, YceG family
MDDKNNKETQNKDNDDLELDLMLDVIHKELKAKKEAAKKVENEKTELQKQNSVTAENEKTRVSAPIVKPATEMQRTRTPGITRPTGKEKVVYFDDIDEEAKKKYLEAKKAEEEFKKSQRSVRTFLGLKFNSVAKLVLYIGFVALSVFLLSTTIINVSNDVFAFVKSDKEITVYIPKNATTQDVAKLLKKNKVVNFEKAYELYTKYRISKRSYLNGKYIVGNHKVKPSMNYDMLIEELSQSQQRGVVRITIPEGLSVNEIVAHLTENGVKINKEEFNEALQSYAFDYRFVKELSNLSTYRTDSNYSYRLEGYLFPDTYDFYTDESAVSIINKMLGNFNSKFEEKYYDRAKELGLTVDQVITLASMIEEEAGNVSEFQTVSSVFRNRLNNSKTYPYMESDATIQYAFGKHKSVLTSEDTKYDHPYNTYLYKGLPPGPISNPGIEAIIAALYPADTNYYYFVSGEGKTVFSKTYAEHQKAVAEMADNK